MSAVERALDEVFFESKMGKYEIVKLAIEWLKLKKDEEGYKNLSQTQLLDKAVRDVLTRNTKEVMAEIEDLKKKKIVKTVKQEEK
ncbi:MAG: hypothetical protein PHI20_06500 [Endomicrobiaceae bacterium]|jgi:hypothetical protein|nr:hypothetical protein [Endomicrobiaceae bacterium]MDD3730668.1 hypothetical protein [Endomicrobiaceae bacterium]MDD4166098.1 hypothetical protein [Endomicrobiaceae bacterium]